MVQDHQGNLIWMWAVRLHWSRDSCQSFFIGPSDIEMQLPLLLDLDLKSLGLEAGNLAQCVWVFQSPEQTCGPFLLLFVFKGEKIKCSN